jgi:hypothetical protein
VSSISFRTVRRDGGVQPGDLSVVRIVEGLERLGW